MKRKGDIVRTILYKVLPLRSYLTVLSKIYFFTFNRGYLKGNSRYDYPYFLDKIIQSGNVCIDIGANLGYYTVLFSKIVGQNGKVYAVEPVKPVLSVLRRNTKSLKNVTIFPFALGTENKVIQLGNNTVKSNGYLGTGSHFVKEKDEETDVEFTAEMRIGSELFADLTTIDFIKCDIEGFETTVIPELKPLIVKHNPILLIETGGNNRTQLLAFFKELNYDSYVLKKDKLHSSDTHSTLDILFVPKSKHSQIKEYLA